MGQSESKERRLFIQVLKSMLKGRGVKVSDHKLQEFLRFIQQCCPWFPEDGTVNPDTWEQVGRQIVDYYGLHGPEGVPSYVFSLWKLFRDSLATKHEADSVLDALEEGEKVPLLLHKATSTTGVFSVTKPGTDSESTSTSEEEDDRNKPPNRNDQLPREDEETLEEAAARYHAEDDPWGFPIRLCSKRDNRSKKAPTQRKSKTKKLTQSRKKEKRPSRPPPYNPQWLIGFAGAAQQAISEGDFTFSKGIYPVQPEEAPPEAESGPDSESSESEEEEDEVELPPPPPPIKEERPKKSRTRALSPFSDPALSLLGTLPQIPQVPPSDRPPAAWEPLPYKVLKEIKLACAAYGPSSPYTVTVLESLSGKWMTPNDWSQTAKACLSGGDYLLWKTEYEDACREEVSRRGLQAGVTLDMLTGRGHWGTNQAQLRLGRDVLQTVSTLALSSWKKLPVTQQPLGFSNIRQRGDEPFHDFVDRLSTAVNRSIVQPEAAELVIKQLAYENANSTCQTLMRSIRRRGTLSDLIRACQDFTPSYAQGIAIAAALQGKSYSDFLKQAGNGKPPAGGGGACFSCGEKGHFSRQCPNKTQSSSPLPSQGQLPKTLCPRCQKGYHWGKDCKSKYHKDGTPLGAVPGKAVRQFTSPAQQQGNWNRGQPQAPQTIGASINPFAPQGSQTFSEPPRGAQDWTSVPPPVQY